MAMQILEYLSQKIKKKIPDGRFLIIFLPNDYDAFATTDNNDASNGIQHLEAFAMHRPKNARDKSNFLSFCNSAIFL